MLSGFTYSVDADSTEEEKDIDQAIAEYKLTLKGTVTYIWISCIMLDLHFVHTILYIPV